MSQIVFSSQYQDQTLTTTPDTYTPFSALTRRSLLHAVAEHSLPTLSETQVSDLMSAYDSLSPFPDVPDALASLSSKSALTSVIFSNGTHDMVSRSINSCFPQTFSQIIVVGPIQKFKPAPEVYAYLAEQVGKKAEPGEGGYADVWLVSSNPFDIVGARAVGLRTCWVDRGGVGWVDALVDGEEGGPNVVVGGLGEVLGAVGGFGDEG
jgi:2-haloacid dehalogenase